MKNLLSSLFIAIACSTTGFAQTNPNAELKRFIRGIEADDPVFKSFVIPLDFTKGIALDAMGTTTAKFPDGSPWFNQIPKTQKYHFGITGLPATPTIDYLATPFENPIVAFGSGAGGSHLYLDRTYRFGVHAGPQVQVGGQVPFSLGFWISAYRKSDKAFMGTQIIVLPRRNATDAAEKSRWDSYINNGQSWPTPQYPSTPHYGLTTQVEFVEGGLDASGWGVGPHPLLAAGQATNPGYVLSHTSTSDEYYYMVESLAYFPITISGQVIFYPNAGIINQNNELTEAKPSTLYAINFDQRPAWKSTDVDRPHFQAEAMPPEYIGKSKQELLSAQTVVTQVVTPGTYTLNDQSPELRQHPILDDFVTGLTSQLPAQEMKAIAIANYVHNEIALCDPISYNESGNVDESSINCGGVGRGALATFQEGQGSPTEKAALLVYMLRKAGIPAAYMFPQNNKLKMLNTRMSSILKMQIKGAVNNLGQLETPLDPLAPSLIPVNYPWVAASITVGSTTSWHHFFPWIADTEVIEGYNLYDYMPAGYKNAPQWLSKYFNNDPNILNLSAETKNPGTLFLKFVKTKIPQAFPGINPEDIGVRYRERKNHYTKLGDFPKPFELTGTPETVANLSSKANIFDTIEIKVFSKQNPSKRIEVAQLPILELHNRKLLLRQTRVDAATHSFSLTMSPFRPGTSGNGTFTNVFANLPKKQVLSGSSNLVAADKNLSVEFKVYKHKRYFLAVNNLPPADRWNVHLGYSAEASYGKSLAINKGDLAALCLNVGKVSPRMLEEHAKEFWKMESDAVANPSLADPDVYQGTAAYLMGMAYYNKVDNFTEENARLHKRLIAGNLAMGLAVLKAEYVGGVLPSGNINYVQPAVDMFYQDAGLIGNETIHANSGIENIGAKKDFESINITAGSALEHEVIDTYFKMGDSISTVELLRIAKANPTAYPNGFYELTINNYLNYDSQMAAFDISLWNLVKSYFSVPDFGKYAKAYITSKPVTGANGKYTGMGALVFSGNSWAALISNNLNGGSGRYFTPPSTSFSTFSSSNVSNLTLNHSMSYGQPSYSLQTLAFGSATAPAFTSASTSSFNVGSMTNSFRSGSLAATSYQTTMWNQSNSILNYGISGSGNSFSSSSFSNSYSTGYAGNTSSNFSLGSMISAAANFVADPVNAITGEFYLDSADLRIDGPMALEIRRNYSSKNLSQNNFGYGWKWSYFPYLVMGGNNAEIIHAAEMDGSVIAYRKQPSGTEWKPISSDNPHLGNIKGDQIGSTANPFNGKIVRTGSTTFTYTLSGADGSQRTFTEKSFPTPAPNSVTRKRPYLDRWADNRGNYYSFEFGTVSSQPGYGEVTRVASSNGNVIMLRYDMEGHILEALAGDGRSVNYRYDEHGDLVEIIRPDSSVVSYEYEHKSETALGKTEFVSNHRIVREVKPNGRVLVNTYDTTGRVTEQRATVGTGAELIKNATFIYTQTENADKTISGNTVIRDAYDHDCVYEYQNSQITKIRDALNQITLQEWYQPGDVSPGAYQRSLKKRVDHRNLSVEYKYDVKGNVAERKLTGDITGDSLSDSAPTSFLYNINNLQTQETDAIGNVTKTFYEDASYPYMPTRTERWVGGTLVSQSTTEYTQSGVGTTAPFAKGLPLRQKQSVGSSDETRMEWTYDGLGYPATTTQFSGSSDPNIVKNYIYNRRGQIVSVKDALNRGITYDYDALGNRKSEEFRNESGGLIGWNYAYYNHNGELEWSDGPRYNPEDYVWRKYDGAGRPLEVTRWLSKAKLDGSGVEAPRDDAQFATSFYKHDWVGNTTEVRDENRNSMVMTYDWIGQMLTRKTYQGNASGTLLSTSIYTYEPGGFVAKETNPLGGVTEKSYTSGGLPKQQINPDGSTLSWLYALDGRAVRETLPNGSYWETSYNDLARIVTKTLRNSGGTLLATKSTAYDRRGNVIQQTDEEGNVFAMTYDDLDRPKSKTGPAATATSALQSVSYVYDNCGKVTEVVDGILNRVVTTTDIMGRAVTVQVKNPSATVVRQSSTVFAADHQSATVTEGAGGAALSVTTYTDTNHKPVLVKFTNGDKTRNVYDAPGNLIAAYDEQGRVSTSAYDALNRVTSQITSGGATTSFIYDGAGNVKERQMPDGLTWKVTYDIASRKRTEAIHGGASVTRQYTYDYFIAGPDIGKLLTATDPRGIVHTRSYDDFGRLKDIQSSSVSGVAALTRGYIYDRRNLPTEIAQTYASGAIPPVTVNRQYDGYGQVIEETVRLNGVIERKVDQTWNGKGQRGGIDPAEMNLPGALSTFTWRADGLLANVAAPGISSAYTYGDSGLLVSRSNPLASIVIEQRDTRGRITARRATSGAATPLVEGLAWNADSTLASYTATRSGAGVFNEQRDYGYNSRGQLTSESFKPGAAPNNTLGYQFDGNRTNGLGVRTLAQVPSGYQYQATSVNGFARVLQDQTNSGRRSLTASGNALGAGTVSLELDGQPVVPVSYGGFTSSGVWTASLSLSPGQHTLVANAIHPGGASIPAATSQFIATGTSETIDSSYDAEGQVNSRVLSTGGIQSLSWDAMGRLLSVTTRDGANNGSDWTALYDGLGRRLRTIHTPVAANSLVIASRLRTDSWFDPQVEFLEIGVRLTKGTSSSALDSWWKVHGIDADEEYGGLQGIGGLEATVRENGSQVLALVNDHFSTAVAGVSTAGQVLWNDTKVGGYGTLPGQIAKPLSASVDLATATVWRSKRIDPTGFYWMGARYYEPGGGRFLSPDPAGHGSSMSLYDYAGGDPVNYTDADGRLVVGAVKGFTMGGFANDISPYKSLGQTIGGAIGQTVSYFVPGYNVFAASRDVAAGGYHMGSAVGNMATNGVNWQNSLQLGSSALEIYVGTAALKTIASPALNTWTSSARISPNSSFSTMTGAGQSLTVSHTAGNSAGALGRQGEAAIAQATGLAKNTESFIVNGNKRIPDFVTARGPSGAPTGLIEAKNVQYQSLTGQLRDYRDLVGAGGRVDVALPPAARVSGPLQKAFDNPSNPLFRMDLPR